MDKVFVLTYASYDNDDQYLYAESQCYEAAANAEDALHRRAETIHMDLDAGGYAPESITVKEDSPWSYRVITDDGRFSYALGISEEQVLKRRQKDCYSI